jgi:hypothetical protein
MNYINVLRGVLAYEFKMQIRRRSLWIVFLCFAALIFRSLLSTISGPTGTGLARFPFFSLIAEGVYISNILLPIPFGIFLADRMARDQRTRVDELFTSMPGSLSLRIIGKYFGSILASFLPMSVCYVIIVGLLLYSTHNILVIPLFLLDFTIIVLPGLLFVAAFSIACPAILWVPLYQFLFVGYWFWGNVLTPASGIPTLSATILTPIGTYMMTGILGVKEVPLVSQATPLEGVASIALLLGISALVLCVLWWYLKWQQARQ